MSNDRSQISNMQIDQIHERDLVDHERDLHRSGGGSQFQAGVVQDYSQELEFIKRRYAYGAAKEDISLRQKKRKMIDEILKLLALRSISQDGSFPGFDVYEIADIFNVKSGFARTTIKEMLEEGRLFEKKNYKGNRSSFTTPELYEEWERLNSLNDNKEISGEHQKLEQIESERTQTKETIIEELHDDIDNELSITVNRIDQKIKKIREKILKGQQKIEDLERAKKHLTEDERD